MRYRIGSSWTGGYEHRTRLLGGSSCQPDRRFSSSCSCSSSRKQHLDQRDQQRQNHEDKRKGGGLPFSIHRPGTESSSIVPGMEYGIVAAMSRNGIIGIEKRIPWYLPMDRSIFKSLTKDRTVILGRRTLEEDPTLDHICHTRSCIVLSTTMRNNNNKTTTSSSSSSSSGQTTTVATPSTKKGFEYQTGLFKKFAPNTDFKVAGSLSEALEMAAAEAAATGAATVNENIATSSSNAGLSSYDKQQEQEEGIKYDIRTVPTDQPSVSFENNVECWIAGGQSLYEEALLGCPRGTVVSEVHLSVVDIDINLNTDVPGQKDDNVTDGRHAKRQHQHVARFPDPSLWIHNYDQISKVIFPPDEEVVVFRPSNVDDDTTATVRKVPGFTYFRYRRKGDGTF